MRPRRLVLKNVGPFVGLTEIDFDALGEIFLISGKTGSGKTTVFDSICYALYGNLPGGRKNQARRMRSDFAPEDAECSVALEFDLGERTYLVERKPPRTRRKARGEGTVEDPESVVLFEKSGKTLTPLGGKKGDADERLKNLIGLSFEEFSKIVLLPQGEFAEFLRQNTTDRREVLKKLFPVDLAVRTREIASDRSKTASARLAEAERLLAEAAARYSPDEYESFRRRSAERLEAANLRSRELEAEKDRLAAALRTAEAERELLERIAEALETERSLDERAPQVERDQARLEAARAARPLGPLLARREEADAEAIRAAETAAAARREAAGKDEELAEAETGTTEAEAATRQAAALREKRGPIAAAAQDERELARLRTEAAAFLGQETAAAAEKRKNEANVAVKIAEIAGLRPLAESADARDAAWEAAREAMDQARALKPLAERAERLRGEREETETRRLLLLAEVERRRREEPILQAELEEIEGALRSAELAGTASLLAADLLPGLPCPVCGSTDHPAPASAPAAAFDLAARRDVRRRNLDDAAKALASKATELKAAEERLYRLDSEAAETASEGAALAPLMPGAEEAAKNLAALSEATTAAAAARLEARKARDRVALLYKEIERDTEAAGKFAEALSGLTLRRAELEAAAAEKEQRRDRALASIGGATGAAAALAALDERMAGLESRAAALTSAREKAGKAAAAAGAARKGAEHAAEAAHAAAESAGTAFSERLAASLFGDEEALRAALLEREEEERLEQEIPLWKEERGRARTLREELEKILGKSRSERGGGFSSDDSDSIRTALASNAAAREKATSERDAAMAEIQSLEVAKAAYEETAERRRSLANENRLLKAVSDDLSGNNPKKKSFDAWLLGAYLAEVAAYATKRLERMSEGRYRLLLDGEREGGRGLAGLDLAVFDAYTGRTRPCATLSGGESFMASISLALGLADSIQSRSGGVRLDAVFIDEGFGSLDDASLDKALSILDEIRDHRMVALISHVGEMKNRIPSRLEIVKTNAGSRLGTG